MLREIRNTQQVAGEKPRRWFFSHEQDLLVWFGEDNTPIAFQLAYGKYHAQHAIRWKAGTGFAHHDVDTGVDGRELALLVPDGPFNASAVLKRFLELSTELPPEIVQFVSDRLREHPEYSDTPNRVFESGRADRCARLSRTRGLLLLLLVGLISACGHDRIHEGDHEANFRRVFGELPPAGVRVLNSVVAEYRWRLGVVSTDDWEFEIVAPRTWIEQQARKRHLGPVGDNPFVVRHVGDRKAKARPWYAPGPLDAYDAFYLTATSIPYVHMLVEKRPQPDGRYRVYLSKH